MVLGYLNRVMQISHTILVLKFRDNPSSSFVDSYYYYSCAIRTTIRVYYFNIIIVIPIAAVAAACFISKRLLNLLRFLDLRSLAMHLFQTKTALSHSCVGSAHEDCIQ